MDGKLYRLSRRPTGGVLLAGGPSVHKLACRNAGTEKEDTNMAIDADDVIGPLDVPKAGLKARLSVFEILRKET